MPANYEAEAFHVSYAYILIFRVVPGPSKVSKMQIQRNAKNFDRPDNNC
jgi:hypothetical protein